MEPKPDLRIYAIIASLFAGISIGQLITGHVEYATVTAILAVAYATMEPKQ